MKNLGLLCILGLAVCAAQVPPVQPPSQKAESAGTWREGFKSAHAKALTFKSWDELYDWAEGGRTMLVPELKMARATDLAGGRHSYVDTRAGGEQDARIGIYDEMRFIGRHNSGDTQHFLEMTREWIKMQRLDDIIPPGHF